MNTESPSSKLRLPITYPANNNKEHRHPPPQAILHLGTKFSVYVRRETSLRCFRKRFRVSSPIHPPGQPSVRPSATQLRSNRADCDADKQMGREIFRNLCGFAPTQALDARKFGPAGMEIPFHRTAIQRCLQRCCFQMRLQRAREREL